MHTTENPPSGRGCGDRKEGSPYACCGLSASGMPIEHFIIDPAVVWPGGFQRGVKILPRDPKDPDGVNDLVVFVGKKFYPSAWDYVEEVRRFGASRKMSNTLPFNKLTPGDSRMIFVHSKAIPQFAYELNHPARPLHGCKLFQHWVENKELWDKPGNGYHPENVGASGNRACTFALKDLTFLVHGDIEPDPEDPQSYCVNMPSFRYRAAYPMKPEAYMKTGWQTGIFMALPLTHFEFCRQADKKAKSNAKKAGFHTEILEW